MQSIVLLVLQIEIEISIREFNRNILSYKKTLEKISDNKKKSTLEANLN